MLVSQISRLEGRAAKLLAKMIELAPVFRVAQFKLDPSTFIVNKESLTKTGSAARAIGSPAQRDAQSPSTALAALAAYTREYSIDEMYLADANVGSSPAALRQIADRKLNQFVVEMAKEIQDDMFVGTGADNRMVGCSVFVADADAAGQTPRYGFTAAELASMRQIIGLQLVPDNYGTFLELLEKELAKVPGANAIEVNTNLAARLTTIAREKRVYGQINDAFNGTLETILNVPIVKLPTTAISSTESDGEHDDCTSLYIKRYAEEVGFSYSTNNGFTFADFPETEVKPNSVSRMSFHIQTSPETVDSVKRLTRIRL
jgi:hypothetical protein